MDQKRLGQALVVGGGLLVLIGIIGWIASGGRTDDQLAEASTTTAAAPSTTEAPATTEAVETTTTTAPVTTTEAVTTTTIAPAVVIETFVSEYAAAIGAGDVEFLFDTIHPAVINRYGEEACRRIIRDEFLLITDYRMVGDVDGPDSEQFDGVTIDVYRVPVAFGFQGREFESQAAFAFDAGAVRWFTDCE